MNEKEKIADSVSYITFEGEMARMERIIVRLWITVIALTVALIVGVISFFWYESQFETISYQQDGTGLNNINTGSQGDVYGSESESAQETSRNSES